MKKTLIIIILLCTLSSFATIVEVKQDSTGDFTIIQQAMDFAQEGDTVLVWPGTYYEHLNFNGKDLTLASLSLTTGEENYKHSTIIDGNHNGSCIIIHDYEDNPVVHGFTIQHGRANGGSGIMIFKAGATIVNCVIRNNLSYGAGSGIYCGTKGYGFVKLSGNSIFNNHARGPGGGITFSYNEIEFDSINRNSIYSNYAERGCDIHYSGDWFMKVFLDTCTVLNPDTYFVSSINFEGYQDDDIEMDIMNAMLTPYDGNLYVNPATGSNENSGTSWDEPLQNIAFAYSKIHVDSLEKNTIYLANGIYSDTTNDEKFPLNIRPFIKLMGESRNGTILDGNRNTYIFKGNNNITDYSLQKMTLQGGPKPIWDVWETRKCLALLYTGNDRMLLDSLVFRDSFTKSAFAILSYYQADSSVVQNCELRDNKGNYGLRTVIGSGTQFINNCIISNQQPDFDDPYPLGKALAGGDWGKTIIQNSLFYDNPRYAVSRVTFGDSYFINCTFANNSEMESSAAIFVGDANMHLYNCISYNEGETPIKIAVVEPQKQFISHLNIYNSLIEGGQESIHIASSCGGDTWCKVHYDSTNIDTDPNFLGMWAHPYMIADGSPCINTGTLANLPDFIELPEFDLAGNPRIVGDSIDMGAYEWNETIVGFNEIGSGNRNEKAKLLKASPNPFDWGTYLSVEVKVEVEVEVEIYDNYGRLLRNILSTTLPEKLEILWYGDDNNGNPLPAGVYHVVMFSGEREVESLKLIKK